MAYGNKQRHVDDEDRRDLLKALGVIGTVAAGSATLEEVRSAATASATDELAPIGQSIKADLAGTIDASLIATQQAELAAATQALEGVQEKGLPVDAPREEFIGVAEATRPVYDHLLEVGFFESTTSHLPEFNPAFLESAVGTFVSSETLAGPLEELGFDGTEGLDMIASVSANAAELSHYHWVASDEIPREEIAEGETIPPVTQAAMGGALLWLEDLDHHLWQKEVILTEEILGDAVWHGQSMAAGLNLMSEGARTIGAEEGTLSDAELGALLSTGFAMQAIAQAWLPEDVYWVTEEMRAPRAGGD